MIITWVLFQMSMNVTILCVFGMQRVPTAKDRTTVFVTEDFKGMVATVTVS